ADAAVARAAGEPRAPSVAPPALPRRAFLANGAAGSAFLIGGGSAVYGALLGRHDYIIEEIAIPIPGLPRSLDGFSIVQLSDIHLGLFVGEPEMRAAEDLVRKARGDLIVMTGDLVDFDPRYTEHLGRLTRRLAPLAREGVAAIPGNHDHFAGIDATLDALARGGAQVLRNRGRVVGGAGGAFALLGVDDVWVRRQVPGGGPDLGRALADVPRDLPRVLLCHNPVFFPESAGEVALQLSGHTHGGQVNLVVRPADVVLPHGYVAGLYQRGGAHLYINRGFGTAGPPARIGAPPEVSRIVLVSA
ncbi:MAG TPA: metallophosphoesterase, partial [Sorangium sp.]|nr:metallophosphoesterase [Sorangium sp.]